MNKVDVNLSGEVPRNRRDYPGRCKLMKIFLNVNNNFFTKVYKGLERGGGPYPLFVDKLPFLWHFRK